MNRATPQALAVTRPTPAAGGAAPPVCVLGTGAVGGYIGGALQAAGAVVQFVARPRTRQALQQHGLHLTDLEGRQQHLPAAALALHAEPPALHTATLVLLCVKAGDTAAAVRSLPPLPAGSVLLSLQNGLHQAEVARAALAEGGATPPTVLPGMVPFNIAEVGPGHLHRGTAGQLAVQQHAALQPWLPAFQAAGLPLALHADLLPVQWGKLLLNLNNPVNALSGLPLRAQLLDRDCRRVLAALQQEALGLLQLAGVRPAQLTPLPPQRLPTVLRLPNWLFTRVAARMLRIDAQARSSMADDLARGRGTEIDALCGEVVRLAHQLGREAPLNQAISALVKACQEPPGPVGGRALRQRLGL